MTLTLQPETLDRAGWAGRIGEAWRGAVASVIETGRLVAAAKAALDHGDFHAMIEADLPFSARTAQRLMKIAADPRISAANATHASLLPPSWTTLHELTRVDDDTFAAAVADGRIRADMERKDAAVLARGDKRNVRLRVAEELAARSTPDLGTLAALASCDEDPRSRNGVRDMLRGDDQDGGGGDDPFIEGRGAEFARGENFAPASAALPRVEGPDRRYSVIYADPPWRFETFSDAGLDRAADNHYPTMTADAIRALPVHGLAGPNCALFLWATSPCLEIALSVLNAWGFSYKAKMVWVKTNADGSPWQGTGHWFRDGDETLLLGIRGDMPAPLPGTQSRSAVPAPVGAHSEKPEIFREIVDGYFPGVAKIELFARRPAPGWHCWGNEVGFVTSGCRGAE